MNLPALNAQGMPRDLWTMVLNKIPSCEETNIPVGGVRSLTWDGDCLIDWVAGGTRYSPTGEIMSRSRTYGFPFDAAVASSDNRYAVIYTRLATKGIVTCNGTIIREINRSYYCADAYEYPVAIFYLKNGRAILAHCPNEYCCLEFEDLITGELLTTSENRKPEDFFHSRLSVSADGEYLISAGWVWHPVDKVKVFHIDTALTDADHLDADGLTGGDLAEESSAAFLKNNQMIVALQDLDAAPQLRIHSLDKSAPSMVIETRARPGIIMPVGEEYILNLYETPKLIDWRTGEIVKTWPHIASGSQSCVIIHGIDPVPQIALDPLGQRCAIADEKKITVLAFK